MGNLALIALGSNLGDRSATLDAAIAAIAAEPGVEVRSVSRYHETAPVGGPSGQGAFLNAAAALETTLDPAKLHRLLLGVERLAGRVREVRWDARTLDLDLLLHGDRVISTPELTVPHPRMAVRRFVIAPLAEVAPDAVDPISRRTIRDLLQLLDQRPSYLAIDRSTAPQLSRTIAQEVANCLGTGVLLASEREDSSTRLEAGNVDEPRQHEFNSQYLDQIEESARKVSSQRDRLMESGADSWLISDFYLPSEMHRVPDIINSELAGRPAMRPGDPQRHFQRAAELTEVIRAGPIPTITVILGGTLPKESLPRLHGIEAGPILYLPASEERQVLVSEVLAACEAARSASIPW